MLEDLLLKCRSYRRFYQDVRISEEMLLKWVNLTRLCPSARNAQPLKYYLVTEEELSQEVFSTLSWAGYLTDWVGAEQGERPSAYLIQVLDTRISENCLCDDGIQAQTILLGATEEGFGGCIIKAFKNEELRKILEVPSYFKIMYVIALGKPKEEVKLEEMKGEDFKYWRSEDQIHHVPKRKLEELILKR